MLVYCDLSFFAHNKLDIIEKIIDHYNIQVKKDIVVYSVGGNNHNDRKLQHFKKIFYTAEPILTNKDADFIIGFIPTHDKYIRLTNYERLEKCSYGLEYNIYHSLNMNWKLNTKKDFCCFIVSNPNCKQRNTFYELLNQYKKVDSLGQFKKNSDILNGIPRGSEEYYKIISKYKFIICFENVSQQYYLTEKIYNAFKSNVIPIYYGDPNITDIFNENTFINIKSPNDFSQTIELIKQLDNNDELYNNYFKEQPVLNDTLHDNRINDSIHKIYELLI